MGKYKELIWSVIDSGIEMDMEPKLNMDDNDDGMNISQYDVDFSDLSDFLTNKDAEIPDNDFNERLKELEEILKEKDTIEKKELSDFEKRIQQASCRHEWVFTRGLFQLWEDCKKCNIKKEDAKRSQGYK